MVLPEDFNPSGNSFATFSGFRYPVTCLLDGLLTHPGEVECHLPDAKHLINDPPKATAWRLGEGERNIAKQWILV